MSTLNQYLQLLGNLLRRYLSLSPSETQISPKLLGLSSTVTQTYLDSLAKTYSLSIPEMRDSVYRVGVGKKLSKDDTAAVIDSYGDLRDRPFRDDDYGIILPRGILVFYEDILYRKGQSINVLATSYHFQYDPSEEGNPLYFRFEFDPLQEFDASTSSPIRDFKRKPIFHYHFSNYAILHKHCHFPAGIFDLEKCLSFSDPKVEVEISNHPQIPNLETFLSLLKETKVI
jgi:hypothetical protein